MKTIKNITTSASHLDSEVLICDVAANGTEHGHETLRVSHAADATPADRAADIEAAVSAASTPGVYSISIHADGVWAGSGLYADGTIRDCAAVLGTDADDTEVIYSAIETAIGSMDEPADGQLEHGGIRYSWTLCSI